jgi:hypothetical protein
VIEKSLSYMLLLLMVPEPCERLSLLVILQVSISFVFLIIVLSHSYCFFLPGFLSPFSGSLFLT